MTQLLFRNMFFPSAARLNSVVSHEIYIMECDIYVFAAACCITRSSRGTLDTCVLDMLESYPRCISV